MARTHRFNSKSYESCDRFCNQKTIEYFIETLRLKIDERSLKDRDLGTSGYFAAENTARPCIAWSFVTAARQREEEATHISYGGSYQMPGTHGSQDGRGAESTADADGATERHHGGVRARDHRRRWQATTRSKNINACALGTAAAATHGANNKNNNNTTRDPKTSTRGNDGMWNSDEAFPSRQNKIIILFFSLRELFQLFFIHTYIIHIYIDV